MWILSALPIVAQPVIPIDRHVIQIKQLPPQELRQIRQFTVLDQNQKSIIIEASLQNFRLPQGTNLGSFQINDTLLSLDEYPEETNIIPEGFAVMGEDNIQYYFQFLISENQPMHLMNDTGAAIGSITIKAIDSKLSSLSGTAKAIKLKDPIEINIAGDGLDKKTVFIESLNWPYKDVSFIIDAKDSYPRDKYGTRLLSIYEPEGYETTISVLPIIRVTARDRIQGFGIQQCPVHIELIGPDDYANISVGLGTDKGYLDNNQVTLQKGSTSIVYLRSEKIGKARVSAISNLPVISAVVYFIFPWSFLLFSIIGAVIGSLIRILRNGKKPFDTRSFIVGVLLGFTVSVCYWALGLDLLNLDLSIGYINEFAVIALSVLGGLLGGYMGRTKQ